MGRYRKLPVVIDAFHWIGGNPMPALVWAASFGGSAKFVAADNLLQVVTLEGVMTISPGDWIIRGVEGEFYPCKPNIFDATYEEAE